jgi:SAM-dependent methyltransferase
MSHPGGAPSSWLLRWVHLIQPGGRVLDLAAGGGRHSRWLAAQGFAVTAVDRDAAAMAALDGVAETLVADLEGAPWPLPGRSFDAVLVTNYLWRPLFPAIVAAVARRHPSCETFAAGNESVGRPARPTFCSPAVNFRSSPRVCRSWRTKTASSATPIDSCNGSPRCERSERARRAIPCRTGARGGPRPRSLNRRG